MLECIYEPDSDSVDRASVVMLLKGIYMRSTINEMTDIILRTTEILSPATFKQVTFLYSSPYRVFNLPGYRTA